MTHHIKDHLDKARAAHAAKVARVLASRTDIAPGWVARLDISPGTGWVLDCPKGPTTYHASLEVAKKFVEKNKDNPRYNKGEE